VKLWCEACGENVPHVCQSREEGVDRAFKVGDVFLKQQPRAFDEFQARVSNKKCLDVDHDPKLPHCCHSQTPY
jgi:hypothetical protein